MELYVHPFPWVPPRLLIFLIVTACCASLLPCSICWDKQYEICQNTSSTTCGNMNISYPFGIGNLGCGLPSFQIDCMQNSSPAITIDGLNLAVLRIDYENHYFITVREKSCRIVEDNFVIGYKYGGTVFQITGKYNGTIGMYKCNTNVSGAVKYTEGGQLRRCNATVYYSLYDFGPSSISGCSLEQITVDVGIMMWVSNDTERDERCRSSGGIFGYNVLNSTAPFLCYCKDGPRTQDCHGQGANKIVGAVGVSVGVVALITGVLVGITVYMRRNGLCCREILVVSEVKDDTDECMGAAIQGKIGTLPTFSYEEVKQATNDFDEKNQIGDGGSGSVYLGKLRDGRDVAVKKLYQDNCGRFKQFINEVQILSTYYHPNLVRLYGFSSPQSQDLLLVYEYVPNGTLADHLHGERKKDKGLNWDTRLKICIETAQALAFLHGLEPPIFHRDVKSTNILLDKHLDVKVADFGLSRFVPLDATHVSTAPQHSSIIRDTAGYVDPEYHNCFQLSDKSDVYSFGVVLMETISGMLAVDITRSKGEIVLANMAIAKIQAEALHEMMDPNLDVDSNPDIKVTVTAVAKLALRCLAPKNEDRPDMKQVVAELEQIKQNGRRCKLPAFLLPSPISVLGKGELAFNE